MHSFIESHVFRAFGVSKHELSSEWCLMIIFLFGRFPTFDHFYGALWILFKKSFSMALNDASISLIITFYVLRIASLVDSYGMSSVTSRVSCLVVTHVALMIYTFRAWPSSSSSSSSLFFLLPFWISCRHELWLVLLSHSKPHGTDHSFHHLLYVKF